MKTSTLFALFIAGTTYCATAQTGGGGGAAGASGGAANPAASGSAANPTASGSAANPAASGSAANPAASGSAATPATGAMIQSNQVATNQFGMNTNMQGSNNLSPTGAASGTNQFVDRDNAVTDNDREILVTIRQNIQAQLGVTSTGMMPVHFNINNGVVILIGFVPTADASQRILLLTQQTPGVTQVDNRLRVGTPPLTPATTTTPAFVGTTTDRGFSPADRQLLFKVQQAASKQLGRTPANGMQLPVHFSIQNGVVSIMGQVFSQDNKQGLLAAVQNTPGVVRVVDNVSVVAHGQAMTPSGTVNPNQQ